MLLPKYDFFFLAVHKLNEFIFWQRAEMWFCQTWRQKKIYWYTRALEQCTQLCVSVDCVFVKFFCNLFLPRLFDRRQEQDSQNKSNFCHRRRSSLEASRSIYYNNCEYTSTHPMNTPWNTFYALFYYKLIRILKVSIW